jgi:hypothetical protein
MVSVKSLSSHLSSINEDQTSDLGMSWSSVLSEQIPRTTSPVQSDGLRCDGLRCNGLRCDGFRCDGLHCDDHSVEAARVVSCLLPAMLYFS